jgi:transposase
MTPSGLAIMLCATPVDLRASFDGLARTVTERLGADAKVAKAMYVFVNKRRDMAKVLWRDRTGWCLLAKRLDTRFMELPLVDGAGDTNPNLSIDAKTLALLLDGVECKKQTTRDIVREARLAAERHTISIQTHREMS